MDTHLPCYYHPTTVCFIDDNYSFLRSLGMDLPDDWSFVSYLHPEEALEAINQPDLVAPLVDRCFTMDTSRPSEPIIHLDLAALEQEINVIQRFQRISVLLVDFAMPTMNGLEFCEKIQNKGIKKALLTGVADEKTAVAAFNRGIIDRYIPKAGLAAMNNVIPHVEELKREYFDHYSARLRSNLALSPPAFMMEAAIAHYFHTVIRQQNIVEYYLTSDPYGYLMLRADGSMLRLIVLSQAELDQQIEVAQQFAAPAAAIDSMRRGKYIGYFDEHPADYLGHEAYPWSEMLVDAQRIQGRQTWYVGLAHNPPADIDFEPAHSSYQRFLEIDRHIV